MLKKIILLLSIILATQVSAESSFDRANSAAQKASKSLDCEFEDCKPEPPKVIIKKQYVPVVVVKEKIVTKEVPVEVEKIVEKEKIVYRDRVVHPEEVPAPISRPIEVEDKKYRTLFVDISIPNDPTFISEYLYINKAGGIDWNQIKKLFLTAPKPPYTIKISGNIEVPAGINSERIYVKPVTDNGINANLQIDGVSWDRPELNMVNAYKKTNTIPFTYIWTYKPCCGSIKDRPKFLNMIEKAFPTIRFSISNKPTQRGARKDYTEAKIFINN